MKNYIEIDKNRNFYRDSISRETKNKLAILVPVSSHIERECEFSLKELENDGIKVYRQWGFSAIDQGRCAMAQVAIDAGYEHLMWIDSDISFYPWDVYKLIFHEKSFVVGTYSVKGWPRLTIRFDDELNEIKMGKNGGLYRTKWAATGFMYTHVNVYQDIVDHYNMNPVKIWGGQYIVTHGFCQ